MGEEEGERAEEGAFIRERERERKRERVKNYVV
jgi:hypothetical protein